ncbi:taste receptor type 2 member 39-like [Engystomops pustulosus]|uniref:taste receptor type 2 member 39-like n=1 Tax=Engystomops pustulosus TaxID=76066 RepID=UPI003AFA5C86
MEICLAMVILEGFVDLSSIIFIIVSLSLDSFQKKSLSPLSRILISLNVSNGFLTIFTALYLFTSLLSPSMYNVQSLSYFFSFMALSSITSSSWLTAALCFFYFIKIGPSPPGFLMNVKNRIDAFTWRLILLVEVVAVGGSFLLLLLLLKNPDEKNSTMKTDQPVEEIRSQNLKVSSIIMMLNGLTFIIIIGTTVASACFLRLYDCRMKKTNGTLVNTNVKDYRSAVQAMTGLLFFYLFAILIVVISTLDIFAVGSGGFWMCSLLLLSFPADQSAFIIYSHPKLKHNLREIFISLTCRNGGG